MKKPWSQSIFDVKIKRSYCYASHFSFNLTCWKTSLGLIFMWNSDLTILTLVTPTFPVPSGFVLWLWSLGGQQSCAKGGFLHASLGNSRNRTLPRCFIFLGNTNRSRLLCLSHSVPKLYYVCLCACGWMEPRVKIIENHDWSWTVVYLNSPIRTCKDARKGAESKDFFSVI